MTIVRLSLSLSLLVIAGCEPDPPGDGFLLVTTTTTDVAGTRLAGFQSASLDVERVDVVHRTVCDDPSTEAIRTVSTLESTVTVSRPEGPTPRAVARVPVPPGCVLQVRLITNRVRVDVDGEVIEGRVPSGPQTGLKINPAEGEAPFPIETARTTTIRVTYDPNDRLVINRGQPLLQKPTLEAVIVADDFPLGIVFDEVVLTFDPRVENDAIADAIATCGGVLLRQGPRHYVTVKLPTDEELREALVCYTGAAGVVAALPNTIIETQGPNPFVGTPSDPFLGDSPPDGFEALNLDAMRAPEAWEITTGSAATVIAVVDSGFDLMHEDLIDRIWINEAEIPETIRPTIVDAFPDVPDGRITFGDLNHPDNDGICPKDNHEPFDRCDPLDLVDGTGSRGYGWQDGEDSLNDDNELADDLVGWDFTDGDNLPQPSDSSPGNPDHGTLVASVALAEGNNARGGIGVAWGAVLMPVRGTVLANPPGVSEGAAIPRRLLRDGHVRGIEYALQTRATVVNSSIGSLIVREDVEGDFCTVSVGGGVEGVRGIRFVPAEKYDEGLQALETEWETMIGPLRDRAILTVAIPNCRASPFDEPNIDDEGFFFWPGSFAGPRPEHGLDFVHATMIGVTNSLHHRLTAPMFGGGDVLSEPAMHPDTLRSRDTAHIAAPGTGWRLPLARTESDWPSVGVGSDYTDCGNPGDEFRFCEGTSLAAPGVAGAVALVSAEFPSLTPLEVRDRILSRAARAPAFAGKVEEERLLDIAAALAP